VCHKGKGRAVDGHKRKSDKDKDKAGDGDREIEENTLQ